MHHCDACDWGCEDPLQSELQGEGCGGVLSTVRVCRACGEEVARQEVAHITAYRANDPRIGYNRWPKYHARGT